MAAAGDYLKDWFLAGIGVFSLTRERIQEIVDRMVKNGEVELGQAESLIKQLGERAEAERRELENLVRTQIQVSLKKIGAVKADDLEKLSERIEKLENLLD